jgi:peptide/nickel transport system permease protein
MRRAGVSAPLAFARAKPLGTAGLLFLLVMTIVAIAAPSISPHDPEESFVGFRLAAPSGRFLFGTDELARDILSRIINGARVSLTVGFTATVTSTALGSLIAVTSAYAGGKVDLLLQRFIDAMSAFPVLVQGMVLVVILGQSIVNVVVALVIVNLPLTARTVRAVALSLKTEPFVESAKAIGSSPIRIVLLYILPNCFATIVVLMTTNLGWAIIVEASLSFLGLGLPPNIPSWGNMLAFAVEQYFKVAPWIVIFPGMALTLTVMSANLLGDALRDTLDPRLRGR